MIHTDSSLIHNDSAPIQADSAMIHGESTRIKPPHWYEFEAATPVNQRYKLLRVCGFVCCVSGAVVDMYLGRPPTEQILSLLGCVLYAMTADPFAAIGALLARASRVILASSIVLIGITIVIPSTGLLVATGIWSLTAVAVVRRFNRRYLMQDTFASAKAIPDAIRTAPESKAGQAWRHGGAKTVNGMAAELGATCKDYAEIKVRELSYYIGYQTADGRTQELIRRCEKLLTGYESRLHLVDHYLKIRKMVRQVNQLAQEISDTKDPALIRDKAGGIIKITDDILDQY